MPPYQYTPLPYRETDTKRMPCFRLVELLPGHGAERIRVRFVVHTSTASRPFETLSFFWGSSNSVEIECDGGVINIPGNLHSCLQELRKDSPRALLWVDAICIDQTNADEKRYIVWRIPSIVELSTRTICWIQKPLLPSVSGLLTRLALLRMQHASVESFTTDIDTIHSNVEFKSWPLDQFSADSMLNNTEAWRDLDTFLADLYFERLWVTLDWVNSVNLVLRCGRIEFSWDTFCSALEACLFFTPSRCPSSTSLLTIITMRCLRVQFQRLCGHELSFHVLVLARQNCHFVAVDKRDFLSALLSLTDCFEPHFPTVDYGATIETNYQLAGQYLGVLGLSLARNLPRSLMELPSWVPDLSLPTTKFLLNHPKSRFQASAVPAESCQFPGDGVLHCDGIILGYLGKLAKDQLPTRRHCDHYNVEALNNIILGEWFEFAELYSRRRRQPSFQADSTKLRLDFANTIQARGCRSVWAQNMPLDDECIIRQLDNLLRSLDDEQLEVRQELRIFYAACFPSHGRRFGITNEGNFCLVPENTQQGDLVCVPHGSRVPFIFRKTLVSDHYENLGECYVNGLMQFKAETALDSMNIKKFIVV